MLSTVSFVFFNVLGKNRLVNVVFIVFGIVPFRNVRRLVSGVGGRVVLRLVNVRSHKLVPSVLVVSFVQLVRFRVPSQVVSVGPEYASRGHLVRCRRLSASVVECAVVAVRFQVGGLFQWFVRVLFRSQVAVVFVNVRGRQFVRYQAVVVVVVFGVDSGR
uniref:(northern house mosquito) hypothetical protein n=1 Tax=Culex pipiens TaxID=7175 RepID=A0A8D8MRP4_CULPI